jgi:hypothetical protein
MGSILNIDTEDILRLSPPHISTPSSPGSFAKSGPPMDHSMEDAMEVDLEPAVYEASMSMGGDLEAFNSNRTHAWLIISHL